MDATYPQLVSRTEEDGYDALSPSGWTQRFYKMTDEPFRFRKESLALGPELFIESNRLVEGSIRVDGRIAADHLQICLVESEKYRLLGLSANGLMQTISFDQSRWDAVGSAPGKATTLNVSGGLLGEILPAAAREILRDRMKKGEDREALIIPASQQATLLLGAMEKCFNLARGGELDWTDAFPLDWIREDLKGLAVALMDENLQSEQIQAVGADHRRWEIACEIERILWLPPELGPDGTAIDDFAARFACSRRLVQIAVNETFGVGFTELKRAIRLHQAKDEILSSRKRVSDVAYDYGFAHLGRFALYYKTFFGSLPKDARKETREGVKRVGA